MLIKRNQGMLHCHFHQSFNGAHSTSMLMYPSLLEGLSFLKNAKNWDISPQTSLNQHIELKSLSFDPMYARLKVASYQHRPIWTFKRKEKYFLQLSRLDMVLSGQSCVSFAETQLSGHFFPFNFHLLTRAKSPKMLLPLGRGFRLKR
jgi:hypothetical protein